MAEQSYILLCRYWICWINVNVILKTMDPLNESQIKANEQFFVHMLNSLHEYGVWCWKDKNLIYKKVGNKLTANTEDLKYIQEIVSPNFFEENFVSIK